LLVPTAKAEDLAPWIIAGDSTLVLDQLTGIEGKGEDPSLMIDRGDTVVKVDQDLSEAEEMEIEIGLQMDMGKGIVRGVGIEMIVKMGGDQGVHPWIIGDRVGVELGVEGEVYRGMKGDHRIIQRGGILKAEDPGLFQGADLFLGACLFLGVGL
jgi:hypothetical protein